MSSEFENPFPAMNPWLQGQWHSVHARLITYVCDQISEQLPPGLAALTEERVEVEDLTGGTNRRLGPDVSIQNWNSQKTGEAAVAAQLAHDPYRVSIWRASDTGKAVTYSTAYEHRLPRIIIPLRIGDTDAVVDLQKAIDDAYFRGRYAYLINYKLPPKPAISDPDAVEWFSDILKEKQLV